MPLPTTDVHVTYRQQFVRCSKPACTVCAPGHPGHGPYWYAYWREGGRKRSAYIGKERPALAPPVTAARQTVPVPITRMRPLPSVPTSFVGREQEVRALTHLLSRSARSTAGRLVTLTGAGGCGKSRLALQVASALTADFPDGQCYVDLGPLADPALLDGAVAASLGLSEQVGRPWSATLVAALKGRRVLLVLDHCTHLRAACARLGSTLSVACPTLRILATSQEALGAPGEVVRPIASLAVPDSAEGISPERLAQVPAVRLFVERGHAAQPAFTLTPANVTPVVQVCRRLDGIPLALELAAAEVSTMPVEGILALLRERFTALAGAPDAATSRQDTVRATFDCAYEQLDAAAQRVLRRLSVFAGSWTVEAAQAICADALLAPQAVPALVDRLRRGALVQAIAQGEERRYRLPDSVREHARERLDGAEAQATRARYAAWYLALAERAAAERVGPAQAARLAQLEAEHDNLRAAVAWPLPGVQGETDRLRLAVALRWFWDVRGYPSEGRRIFATVLAECAGAEPVVRARALAAAGDLAMRQADYAPAEALLGESLALCRALGEQADAALALTGLGNVATYGHDLERARALRGESLAIRRALGDTRLIAGALDNLGEVAQQRGELAEATALYAEGLALARAAGDDLRVGSLLNGLGFVAYLRGEYEEAAARFRESLALQRTLDDRYGMTFNLEDLALVAAAQGQAMRSARLFGAVETLRGAISVPLQPTFAAAHEAALARLRAELAEADLAESLAAGRAMTLEEVLDATLA